jgi:hypothetical protein
MSRRSAIATAFGLSALLAVGGLSADPAPAKADGGLITGLIIGGIAGHVITRHHDRHYYGHPRRHVRHYNAHDAHVNWCHNRYRSYNAYDNTWLSYSGHIRQCRSPYWG